MKKPSVAIHLVAPRKKSLGGAYFHNLTVLDRWSISSMASPAGVNIGISGPSPASTVIELTGEETQALIKCLDHAVRLHRKAAGQAKKAV